MPLFDCLHSCSLLRQNCLAQLLREPYVTPNRFDRMNRNTWNVKSSVAMLIHLHTQIYDDDTEQQRSIVALHPKTKIEGLDNTALHSSSTAHRVWPMHTPSAMLRKYFRLGGKFACKPTLWSHVVQTSHVLSVLASEPRLPQMLCAQCKLVMLQ